MSAFNSPFGGGTGTGGDGETNTAANVGTGAGLYKEKAGVQLRFKTIKAGANVTVTEGTDEVTVASTATGTDHDRKHTVTSTDDHGFPASPTATKYLRDDGTWETPPDEGGVWGSITGTLPDQTDLQTSLSSKKIYHGIESVGTPESIIWDQAAGARTITLVGPVTYWYKGTRVHSAVDVVCNLLDVYTGGLTDNNLYYIAFEDTSGILKASQSMNLKEKVPVCMVFWNGTDAAVTYELHNHERDLDWHINAHLTIGTRYRGGLAVTSPTNVGNQGVLNITEGIIVDEDINSTLLNAKMTSLSRIFYQVSAGVFTFANSTLPYAGTIGAPTFINTTGAYTPATFAGGNQFACYWVYGTADIDRPIYIYPTHANAAYGSIALARAEAIPNITGVVANSLNPEMKLLYRWIYKGDGAYQEVTDYRMSSTLPAGGVAPATAGAVTYSNVSSGLTATNVQAAIDEVVEDLAAVPAGDVVGPATNTDNNVPQWSGVDSKTLKDGLAVGTAANNLLQLDGDAKLPAVDGSNLTNLPTGFADPMTTRGDVIVRGSAGTTRLGIGTVGQVVTSDGMDVGWAAPAGETDPVVGAITGIVKADGAGTISAAVPGTDYEPAFGDQVEKTFFAGPATGADAAPTFRTVLADDIPTLNQNTTGTAANVTDTVAVANGGTGQTTEQLAINALTDVAGATDEHVLTKDTATGNAVFKAAAGGGSGGHIVQDAGTAMTARANLNFTGAGVTVTDDSGNDATVIDIPASGGGTGGGDTFLDITLTYSHHSLHGTTTTNTATEIFLNGNTNSRIIILPEQTVGFRGLVTAHNEDSGDAAVWSFEGAVKNVAGTVTVVDATITKNAIAEEGIGYDVAFEADNTNKALIVKVTGVSAEPVFWRARVDTTISYDGSLGFGVAWDQNSDYLWRIGSAGNYTRASFDDISPWKDMRRCMMNDDGTLNYYIDPDAPTLIGEVVNTGTYTTGNAANYTGAHGQVMDEIVKFYYKSEKVGTVYRWWILPTPATGFSVHPAFIRPRGGTVNVATSTVTRASGDYFRTTWVENDIITIDGTDYTIDSVTSTTELVIKEDAGTLAGERYICTVGQEIDKMYFSAFEGNVLSSTMRSISGVQPSTSQNVAGTIANFRTYAKARGTGINNWNQQEFLSTCAVQLLYLIEYASFDSQTMIGQGVVNFAIGTVNHSINTGGTIALGNTSGGATGTDGLVSISYRGIENFWANIWKWVDGLNLQNYEAFVSNHDFLHDVWSGRYQSAGSVLTTDNTYVKDIVFNGTDYSFLASVGGGNSGGWLHDNWRVATGNMIDRFGGSWNTGAFSGAFCLYLNHVSSYSDRFTGSRLSYIP